MVILNRLVEDFSKNADLTANVALIVYATSLPIVSSIAIGLMMLAGVVDASVQFVKSIPPAPIPKMPKPALHATVSEALEPSLAPEAEELTAEEIQKRAETRAKKMFNDDLY